MRQGKPVCPSILDVVPSLRLNAFKALIFGAGQKKPKRTEVPERNLPRGTLRSIDIIDADSWMMREFCHAL